MTVNIDGSVVKQIDDALTFSESLKDEKGQFMADTSAYDTFWTQALAAILRSTGDRSPYAEQARYTLDLRQKDGRTPLARISATLVGILTTIKEAINSGYLESVSDIIHGSVFADFLEMAQHLLDHGYKDAAAVIAGSSLEAHLRHLCSKHGVDPDTPDGKPKKADRINADLTKANTYEKSQQKHITAWLGLRNDAAHGDYGKYTDVMVGNLISSIRHFVSTS